MFKKIISLTLSIIMVLGCVTFVFAAENFSDVNEKQYSWAVAQINEMAEQGIINGYPDGTFKPANGITKIEAMLLISRILGINNDAYSSELDDIYSLYEDELGELNLQYENEVAFLIYKGIFTVEEIVSIADELKEPLLRYEAAEYLTKVMDAMADISDDDTGYADESDIPAKSRGYVKYVKDHGIMQGMSETTFDPSFQVNRAQMAVMLYRIIEKQQLLFMTGVYANATTNQINVNISTGLGNYDISEAEFYINGDKTTKSKFKAGSDIVLVFENAVLKRIEYLYITPEESSTVTGEVKEITLTSVKTVKIEDSYDGEAKIYSVSPECEVYVDGSVATLSVLRTKDNAKLYLDSDDVVYRIDVLDVNFEIKDGIIQDISFDDLRISVMRKDGTVETYFASDDIIVTRNSKDAQLKDLITGDEITYCIVRYNKITSLKVKSEIGSTSGIISEIVISKNSSVVINKDGIETRYPLTNSIKIYLDDKECEVYDLRMDMNAEITTDSGAVSEIRVTSVDEIGQISGTVEDVNPTYGFINVKIADGNVKQIFVSSSTKITADGAVTATKTIKNIREGDYVVVIGKTVNGAFQASTIVIVDQ